MEKYVQTARALVATLRNRIQARLGSDIALTEREKLGLVAGSAVILLAAWLGLSAWVSRIESSYTETQINLARLKSQVESGAWPERKTQSKMLRAALEARFWSAETPGLAEAGFERWIRENLNRNNVEVQQIQVKRVPLRQSSEQDGTQDPLMGLQRMTAKVFIPFDEPALLDLLSQVSENEKMMVVDRLIVRAGRNARVEMDVSTFFRYHEPAK